MAAQESVSTPDLRTRVALVTGASRGVGRGVALGLAHAGARVFATGRSIGRSDPIPGVTTLVCDHTDDQAVASVFSQIDRDAGTLDILVNVAWGGYERMVEDGRFTWGAPFWEQPDVAMGGDDHGRGSRGLRRQPARGAKDGASGPRADRARLVVGGTEVRAATSSTASRRRPPTRWPPDMAHELGPHGVTAVVAVPGLVRTEAVIAAGVFDLSNSESPEFIGRAVAALAGDPDVGRWNGSVLVAAALAQEYGFTDIDGRIPQPLEWNGA